MISLFSGLREQRLVELLVGLSLHLVLVFDLGHILLPPVGNLQKEHAVVVDHVEEDDDVDNQGEQVLHGGSWVAFVDLLCTKARTRRLLTADASKDAEVRTTHHQAS